MWRVEASGRVSAEVCVIKVSQNKSKKRKKDFRGRKRQKTVKLTNWEGKQPVSTFGGVSGDVSMSGRKTEVKKKKADLWGRNRRKQPN